MDKDVDRVTHKNVDGVGSILSQLKEATTAGLISAGEGDGMEEGEEPIFTHAEEIKRQIRREERKKKRTEEFKIAKETCTSIVHYSRFSILQLVTSDKPADDAEAVGDPYKTLFISRLVQRAITIQRAHVANIGFLHSIKARLRAIFAVNSKVTALSNGSE